MTNHCHLLLETADGNLSRGMRQEYQIHHKNKDEAMAQAYLSGAYTMAGIGQYFGVRYMTVSRAVRKFEGNQHGMLEC
jgi:hypothetical protein